jgi:glycine/D-amino acid oxidase-like deaminating enzyme
VIAMEKVIDLRVLPDYRLEIAFDDGTRGIANLKERLDGPIFEPLRDPAVFAQARIDEFGAVCWPNGADLAPDALCDAFKSQPPAITQAEHH